MFFPPATHTLTDQGSEYFKVSRYIFYPFPSPPPHSPLPPHPLQPPQLKVDDSAKLCSLSKLTKLHNKQRSKRMETTHPPNQPTNQPANPPTSQLNLWISSWPLQKSYIFLASLEPGLHHDGLEHQPVQHPYFDVRHSCTPKNLTWTKTQTDCELFKVIF